MKEGKGGLGTGRVRAVIARRGGSEKQKRMGVMVTGTTKYRTSGKLTTLHVYFTDAAAVGHMMTLRERKALAAPSRGSSQLAAFWKLKSKHKLRSSVPDVFEGNVPDEHPFTCVTLFQSLLLEELPLLYSLEGKCIFSPADAKMVAYE
eukprot:6213320-Pleurochrysis_carterae.AAC.7